MAHLDDQLRSEIASLEEHISRTGDRFVATHLVAELLPSLQRLAGHVPDAELAAALEALCRVRDRFRVNGQLSVEVDALVARLGSDEPAEVDDDSYAEALLPPEDDPGDTAEGTAQVLFEEEDEELDGDEPAEGETQQALFQDGDGATEGDEPPMVEAPDQPPPTGLDSLFAADDDGDEADDAAPAGAAAPADEGTETPPPPVAHEPGVAAPDSIFHEEDAAPGPPAEVQADGGDAEVEFPPSDELFDVPVRGAGGEQDDGGGKTPPERALRAPKEPAPGMPRREVEELAASVNIFAHTVALDDLQAALDIAVPTQDLTQLEHRLRARLTDKVVATLRESRLAEGQYILIPRVSRFVKDGAVVACTLRNLARAYTKLFGDLRDLRPYVSDRIMTGEVPEAGWSLITAEAPRESLGKSHMEQNQYLRYLATTLGIPSHLIRRRTLVEAVYDAIVGRLVLGQTFQRQTLDWTTSAAGKSEFLCMYSAEEGIRIRQLSRTTRHPALGACPNW